MITNYYNGRGVLHRADESVWGLVEYSLTETSGDAGRPGRITAKPLRAIIDPHGSGRFSDIRASGPDDYAALKLEDGRWWLCCVVRDDGKVQTYKNGILPAGPQPKP
jgi:hypothetical protein